MLDEWKLERVFIRKKKMSVSKQKNVDYSSDALLTVSFKLLEIKQIKQNGLCTIVKKIHMHFYCFFLFLKAYLIN